MDAGSALPESKDGSCPMMNKLKYDQTWQISHYIEQCIIQYKHNHLVYEYGGGGGGAKTKKKFLSGACLFSLYENPPIPLSLRLIAAVRLISEYVMDLKEQRRSIPVNAKGPGSGG